MDERYGQSIELSYEEIQEIMVKVGFEMKEVERFCSPYADNMYVLVHKIMIIIIMSWWNSQIVVL